MVWEGQNDEMGSKESLSHSDPHVDALAKASLSGTKLLLQLLL